VVWTATMHTYSCMLDFLPHNCNTFNDGCSGVVDAIEHRLQRISACVESQPPYCLANLQLYHRGSILHATTVASSSTTCDNILGMPADDVAVSAGK
jgi:hypothetical protein